MANNNINIKLTSEQKIEQLKSGKPIYADSFLDTSEGKHLYDVTDKTLKAFLKTQEVIRVSATELSKLYETGFRNFEEQIKYLEDQRNKINAALQTATESEKKGLIEDNRKVEASLKSVREFQAASNRKSPIGTAVHKLLEMTIKKEIDLSNEEAALAEIKKVLNLKKGSLPELSAIYRNQNSLRYAIRAAKSLSSLMSEAQMVGGQSEKARTALIPANGKIYMISGTSDWDTKGRLGDYKTTSKFDPTHNIIQTIANAFLKRMESGNLGEQIVGQVLHLPLTSWGQQKASGSIYKINPGTYNEGLDFIMNMIGVLEGKKNREDIKLPGTYQATARKVQEVTNSGKISGTQYAGRWMGSWLKESPAVVENMLANLDQRSREKFIRSLFSMGDSGYYRTGITAESLRNKYAKKYLSDSSLSKMQKFWEQDQYKDIIAKVIEEKAEQDPGIIYGLVYGNTDYGSISDEFYDWAKKSSAKTGRYLDIVSGLGGLGSGQTPTEEEKKWLDQGRSKYKKWQPDVFELAESKDVATLEQAEGEIKELPSQHEVEKATNELISFLTYYPKILDLVHKYMEQSGISGDAEYEAKMIESFLAKRETEMGYQGGYEKFMSSKEVYDALISPREERIKELQEVVEEARDQAEKEDTQENRDNLVKLVKELEDAQANVRNVTLREIIGFLQEKASSFEEGEVPERQRKTLNKLDYYKKIGYWSMINDIFDKRMSYFNRSGPQFTYASDVQKLLEQSENIEDFTFEKQKKKVVNKLSFPEDEQRQKRELERRFKKHQEELDKSIPSPDILTPEQFTVSEILNKIQEEYFGTKVGSTIIDTPQMNKIKNILIKNIVDQGESFEDFLFDVKTGEKLSERGFGWMRKLFSSEGFVGFEEEIGNLYDEYSASALGARETEIDEEAMSRATSDIKKAIKKVSVLNQDISGLEEFLKKEFQERTEKEKEFKEPGEDWWYQIQPDIGGSPKWFKTSQDMSKYTAKTNGSAGDIVSGSFGNKFYTGELIQTSRTRPWATYYEGHDPYADSFDVMQYEIRTDAAQKIENKKEEISNNLSDVISDSVVMATNDLAENEAVSENIAEKVAENVETQDLKKNRSNSAKKGWATRRNKKNLLSSNTTSVQENAPTISNQGTQGAPLHVIIDGTVPGDFKNKKTVMETWDADGNLISFSTKDVGKRSGGSRGTPQLDVIKQIKEDTGKIVDMMASQPPSDGGSNLPPVNEPPFGGGSSFKRGGDKDDNQEKALRSEYIKHLREKYELLIKIDALEHKQKQMEGRKEDVTGVKKDIEVLKSAELSVESEILSSRFSGLSGDDAVKNAEDAQRYRREYKKSLLGVGDAEDTLKAFERYATKRMKLESEIEQAQLKASTTVGNEKKAWENVVALKQQSLKTSKETYEILKKQAVGVDKDRAQEIIDAVDQQKAIVSAQKLAGNRGNRTIFDVIKSDIQRATMRITDFGLAARMLNTARKEIQMVYQNVLKLNEAATNLRIITGSNTEQAKNMMVTYNDLAMQLGTTTQAVSQSAAEWLRQGYSVSETNELIKSSTYLSRLGFMDMNQSVTALTSVMKGFRIEAADSMDIVDKLTQLDAKYATTAGDIATALSRTSAVAREAGLNLDQTAAALTTMIDVSQQDASSVGNAFRTILARYGNVKAGAFTSLVGDPDDIEDANASINDTEKVLGAIGIKVRSSAGDMRDFYDVMEELAEIYPTLDEVTRNAVATALGGTRQRNLLSIMIQNWDQVKESQEEAEKAQGTAAAKMAAYNESIEFSIQRLSTAWESFSQKLAVDPVVKGAFEFLTGIIDNLDIIMTSSTSLLVSLNSFKIPTDIKRISGFLGVGAGGIGDGNVFDPSRMTEKAKEYGQKFSGSVEERASNNVVAAADRLVRSIDNNTAAQNQNAKNPTTTINNGTPANSAGNNVPRSLWLTGTGSTVSIKSIKSAQKEYEEAKRQSEQYAEGVFVGAHKKTAEAKARYDQLRELRSRELKANWKTSAIRGGATGVTAGVFAGLTTEGDISDKIRAGLTSGVTTGLLTAIPGIGPLLGPMLGPTLGKILDEKILKPLLKADEIARKERVEQAKENLEAIKGISTSVTGLIDLRKKGDTSLWDADDWKQANEYVESLEKARNSNEGFQEALNNAVNGLGDFTLTIEKLTKNQDELAKVEAARIKYEAEQTYAAGEEDRYTLLKEIEEAQKKLISGSEEEKENAEAIIKANKASIQEYTDALNKAYMKSAFYSSGVSTMSQAAKNTASLDRLIVEMAEAAEEAAKGKTDEKFFEDNGTLKSEYRSKFIQQLREQGGYEDVLTESEKSVGDYNKAMRVASDVLAGLSGNDLPNSIKGLKELVNTRGGIEKLGKALNVSGDELNKIVDQINDADETKVATIAHSLNMTVEEFNEANNNGDFDFFTTGMAVENLDAFIDRVDKLNGYLAELATNGKLSAESLENVVKNYAFLMQGANGSFGAENILGNLAELYAQGADSPMAQLLAGKFQREAATNETWWNAWTQSSKGQEFIAEDVINTTYTSFSDAISSMSEEQKKSYIDYVSSLYNTDLYEEVRKQLVEWQTKAYETEISNLESIRDSLDDVNKQREKELELIKAKEALENASMEKKRVYRAGVGFVYTADQETIRSAQEKVDEIEKQMDKDNIQYQIDMLEQQKSILANIEENEQLKNLTDFVQKIQEAIGEDGSNLFSQILNKTDIANDMKSIISDGIAEGAAKVKEQENLQATKSAADEYKKAGEEYDKFMEENRSILEDTNNPAYTSTYSDYLTKLEALTNARAAYNTASKSAELGANDQFDDKWQSVGKGYTEKTGGAYSLYKSEDERGISATGYMYEESPEATGKDFYTHMVGENRSKKDKYIVGHYDTDEKTWKFYYPSSDDIDTIKEKMDPYDILINDWYSIFYRDRAVFMDKNRKFRWLDVDSNSGLGWADAFNPSSSDKYASGTLSSLGGRSLINENGLESIITPQGTITSLPAKSGVVPADLTRNLWALGEVAPNLISRLSGSSLQSTSTSSATDNSTNIGTLNATFNTSKDFDAGQFLTDLRSEIRLTKNNN